MLKLSRTRPLVPSLVVHAALALCLFFAPVAARRPATNASHSIHHPFPSTTSFHPSAELGCTNPPALCLAAVLGVVLSLVCFASGSSALRRAASVSPTCTLGLAMDPNVKSVAVYSYW
ncbi:hypothetical protein DFH06DRAFT_73395 [Mycena polygramma]|nr:hypothetical protein DFH06DRAFT_73395 [Mycena polygramma]